ncbi:POT family proton-dependent oligopeptide transporter [[Emmonsia] crescens]|uniref:POT family proton-dependent oligopeptide transporter n=1 Tax=[Emmonsia] crescens TaxID=73230 RepID=A0A0G2J9S1_9EURO|nr:POT family proton-dependent oligopeptide transporter [Emmonsia crescens UAMH 3008]
MATSQEVEVQRAADSSAPEKVPVGMDEKSVGAAVYNSSHGSLDNINRQAPTLEELTSLRRIPGKIPWIAFSIAFVELCERFSYYGTTIVFVNFIQRELPPGSTTGSSGTDGTPGALGLGQRASTGITLFNNFWSYIMPLVGAYVADEHLGRFNTIMYSIAIALVGHTILIISAIPPVLKNPNGAVACFAVGIVIMGVGTGGFKSNISPLIAEQYTEEYMFIETTKEGERVIVDPAATISRIYHYFYLMINIGALAGQLSMVYAEKYVGFYLSYLLPTCMFTLCPLVLYLLRHKYSRQRPVGSVYGKAWKVWRLATKGQVSWNPARTYRNFHDPDMWERAKPSNIANKPVWMTFDDAWVDEVRRGLKACAVFLWYPLFWLSYNQMLNNLLSQAATMELNGVPNDVISNLNPFALIVFIPLLDRFFYPTLRKMGINLTPVKRIAIGFVIAGCSMIAAAVTQHYIYKLGPCGKYANICAADNIPAPISVWVQTVPYVLGGISEIFASVTSLEYAFTKAPKNMRSLVQAVALFTNAISAALGQALVSLSEDPLLEWNYGVTAILAFVGAAGFWISNRGTDRDEDALNNLPAGDCEARANDIENKLTEN